MHIKTSNSTTNFNWFLHNYCTFNNRFFNSSLSTYSIVIASILRPVSYTCSLSFLTSNIGIDISLFYQPLPVFTNDTGQELSTITDRSYVTDKGYISECALVINLINKSRYPIFAYDITFNLNIFNGSSTFNNIRYSCNLVRPWHIYVNITKINILNRSTNNIAK